MFRSRRGTHVTERCTPWDPTDCAGTVGCPPRCPRFVDRRGVALLVEPLSERHLAGLVSMYEGYSDRHRSMGLPPRSRPAIESWLAELREHGSNFLARDGDRIVGHAAYTPTTDEEPEFVVFVDPDYHDRGIGTELCRQLVAHAAEGGYEALTLDVDAANRRAIRVYDRVGFELVDRRSADVRMRLPFDGPVADAVRRPPAERPSSPG